MQTNLNCNCPKPQFGMAMRITPEAKEILRARNMSDAHIEKLGKLID